MTVRIGALIYGACFHYIDHLAPLCAILNIPLLVTEEEMQDKIMRWYPGVEVIWCSTLLIGEYIMQHFALLFVCTPRLLFDEVFFFAQAMHHRKIHTIWCPHGNSDKGHLVHWMETLEQERALLLYGDRMCAFLKQKHVCVGNKHLFVVGDYRRHYYLTHKAFYEKLMNKMLYAKLAECYPIILYAPTWCDAENSSSFKNSVATLVMHLPEEMQLLIKPHPHLLLDIHHEIYLERCEEHPRVLVLRDFLPVHPLLSSVHAFIGDFSSVGYDALYYELPMVFLAHHRRLQERDLGLYLFQCGRELPFDACESVYTLLKDMPHNLHEKQRCVYHETFAEIKDLQLFRQHMHDFCRTIVQEELDVF